MKDRLRALRKFLCLTQEEFGKKIGITNTAVSKLENGENNLSEQSIFSICRVYDVNEAWLRTGRGDMFTVLDRDGEIVAWSSKITRSDFDNQFVPEFIHMLSKLNESDWSVLEKISLSMYNAMKKD